MGDFHDAIATLCAKEMFAARQADDQERFAGLLSSLADLAGKTIAMVSDGDAATIDKLLAGFENTVAETASEWQSLGALAARRRATESGEGDL